MSELHYIVVTHTNEDVSQFDITVELKGGQWRSTDETNNEQCRDPTCEQEHQRFGGTSAMLRFRTSLLPLSGTRLQNARNREKSDADLFQCLAFDKFLMNR
jgi:hypothetical protein